MTDAGWIAVYRGFLEHEAFRREPFTEREAFLWMLFEAAYQEREQWIAGQLVTLSRGELTASVRHMGRVWGWGEGAKNRVSTLLRKLEAMKIIQLKTGTGINVISICNYERLQPKAKDAGTPAGQDRDSSGTAAGQYKRRKEGNKEITPLTEVQPLQADGDLFPGVPAVIPKAKKPRGKTEKVRWPDGLDLDGDLHKLATDAGIPFDRVAAVWDKFRRHHTAKGNRFAGLRGWGLAWQNWVANEIEYSRQRSAPAGRSTGASSMRDAVFSLMNEPEDSQ
jgi:hypothetical protein